MIRMRMQCCVMLCYALLWCGVVYSLFMRCAPTFTLIKWQLLGFTGIKQWNGTVCRTPKK